jgi:putative peptide zinc metalloprotease protein
MKTAVIYRAVEERRKRLPRPKLAEGVELLGEYEGSGYREPQFLARRSDGQVLQLPGLLYRLGQECDGRRDIAELAGELSDEFQLRVSPENVLFLVEQKLQPLGVVERSDGEQAELRRADPLLALTFRAAVIPPSVVNGIAWLLRPLFFPVVAGAVFAWLVTLDVWLFFNHGVAQSMRQLLYQPVLLLLVLGLIIVSAIFHEFGHATACRYGGARPGPVGAGLYLVWPALYTDVTDAYRLGRWGRLRTDLGGIYFNAIFILGTAGVYFLTGYEPLLAVIALQHAEILHQFIPWVRLDGYYVVSDLTGVPDVLSRVKPTLASLIPWRKTDERVAQLKPWVRIVVTAYVFTVVPILAAFFGLILLTAPRIFATAWDSGAAQTHQIATAISDGRALHALLAGVQLVALSLPALALALTFARVARRVLGGTARVLARRRPMRVAVAVAAGVAATLTALAWSAPDAFTPISPVDRGTLSGGVRAFAHPLERSFPQPARQREPNPTVQLDRRRPPATTSVPAGTSTRRSTTSRTPSETIRPAGGGQTSPTPTESAPVFTEPTPTTSPTVTQPTTTDTVPTTTTTTPTTTTGP